MCAEDQGRRQSGDQFDKVPPIPRIQIAGGFIQGQDAGIHGEHRGQRHPLALSLAEMMRGAARIGVIQHHVAQGFLDPLADLLRRNPQIERTEGDILKNRRAKELIVGILEEEPHLLADELQIPVGDRLPEDAHGAGALQDPIQMQKKRGLAGAARADQSDPLAFADVEVDIVQGQSPIGVCSN